MIQKDTIKSGASNLYDGLAKDVDYWKHYIKSESLNAATEIWDNAHEDLQYFLEDYK